jgi:1-acyl-sn-glycerol-3-phosphate acyltransferase
MKKMSGRGIVFWVFIYPLVIILGALICFLRVIRVIQVKNLGEIVFQENGSIIISNHRSKFEPILIPLLLIFPGFIFHPVRLTPYFAVDDLQWYNNWWFWPFREIAIPINRTDGGGRDRASAAIKIMRILKNGGVVIIFPEGTRTYKAERAGDTLCSRTGKVMGKLKEGVALLAVKSEATIFPLWCENTDRVFPNDRKFWPRVWKLPIRVVTGKPFYFSKRIPIDVANQVITEVLLGLADE